jgi:hypothetical protein
VASRRGGCLRGTFPQARPPHPPGEGAPGAARCLAWLGLLREWSGRAFRLLLLPGRQPLLFELWEAGGSQAAGVRSSRQRPHSGALRIPTAVRSPFPALPPTHSPTHPELGRQPRSRTPPPPRRDPGLPPATGAGFHVCPGAGVSAHARFRAPVPSAARTARGRRPGRHLGQVRLGRVQRRSSSEPEDPWGVWVRAAANGLRRAGPERAAARGPLTGWRRRLRAASERCSAVGAGTGLRAPGRIGLRFLGRPCSADRSAATPATASASLLHQTGAELGRYGAARGAMPERLHGPLFWPVHWYSRSLSLWTFRSSPA